MNSVKVVGGIARLTTLNPGMESLRNKISSAAQKLYLREGVEGVSMRKVAEMVGVSAPAIYRHFRNKDELLNEIVIEGLRIFEEYLRPGLDAGSPYDRLLRMTDNYLNFAIEEPRYFDFAFLVPPPSVDSIPAEIEKRNWSTFKLAIEQVGACVEQGILVKDDPLEMAITIWAEVHGLVTLYRTGRFGDDSEQFRAIYRSSVRRMLRGMMTDDARERQSARSRT